jgi:dihydrofolate reductase
MVNKARTVMRNMPKQERPKISIYIASSIDGYIAREDGGLDWLDCAGGFDEDYGFCSFLDSIDAVILGRKTYEVPVAVNEWPYKGKRVIVLSRTLNSVKKEAELFSGDVTDLIAKVHSEGIRHIWIDGGVTIAQFLKSSLIDQIIISIIPVILGSGIRLFNPTSKELSCRLVFAKGYPSGLAQVCYETHFSKE